MVATEGEVGERLLVPSHRPPGTCPGGGGIGCREGGMSMPCRRQGLPCRRHGHAVQAARIAVRAARIAVQAARIAVRAAASFLIDIWPVTLGIDGSVGLWVCRSPDRPRLPPIALAEADGDGGSSIGIR